MKRTWQMTRDELRLAWQTAYYDWQTFTDDSMKRSVRAYMRHCAAQLMVKGNPDQPAWSE